MDTRTQVIRLALVTAVALLGDSFIYIALPLFWQEAGLESLWQVGILLSINRLIRLPLHPLVAWLYSKVTTRTGLWLALSLAFLTTAGCGLVHSFAGWLLLRAAWGVAWTLLRQGTYLRIYEISSASNRGYLNGLFNGYYRLGSLFGMAAGGILCEWFTYGQVLLLFAALMLPVVGFLHRLSGDEQSSTIKSGSLSASSFNFRNGAHPRARSFTLGWGSREVAVLVTSLLVALIYQGMFTSTISKLVETHLGDEVTIGDWLLGAGSVAGIVQGLRWSWEPWVAPWIGRMADGAGERSLLFPIILFTGSGLFLGMLLLVPKLIWLMLIIGVLFTATLASTLLDALMAERLSRENKLTFLPTYTLAVDLGAALGPLVGFWLPELLLLSGAACLLCIAAGYWMYIRSKTVHTTIIEPSDQ